MELATTFTPVELAALALRILPSATQLYAEAHDIIHHSEVLTATSDTDTLPAFYWLTVCARDAAGNHRVIIDLPKEERVKVFLFNRNDDDIKFINSQLQKAKPELLKLLETRQGIEIIELTKEL